MNTQEFIDNAKPGDVVKVDSEIGKVLTVHPKPNNGTVFEIQLGMSVLVITPAMSWSKFEIVRQ